MKREERQKVYAFPLQMASVKDNLAQFVGRLFQPNPYQENPIFRGFYFTSGTQEGVPLDRWAHSAVSLAPSAPPAAPERAALLALPLATGGGVGWLVTGALRAKRRGKSWAIQQSKEEWS